MTLSGKRDDFTRSDFEACGELARLKRGESKAILCDVQAVVSRWRDYAEEVGVDPGLREKIWQTLRLE